jgi:hypothetical protein
MRRSSRDGSASAVIMSIWAARRCGSVTSTFSRLPPAGAERSGRSRTAPRRRAHG